MTLQLVSSTQRPPGLIEEQGLADRPAEFCPATLNVLSRERFVIDPKRAARHITVTTQRDTDCNMDTTRRRLLVLLGAGALGFGAFGLLRQDNAALAAFAVSKTEEEWKQQLTADQFSVLRQHATERPFTSPLLHEERAGVFACAACDLALYNSSAKFDSGTGWPSFFDHLPNGIGTSTDFSLVLPRTEVHCMRCGGHLGHVFDDGPTPTGKRYCMNGAALQFHPTQTGS